MNLCNNTPRPLLTALLCIVLLASTPLWANSKIVSPEEITGTIKVDAEEVIHLVSSMDNMVIVDSRITADRQQGSKAKDRISSKTLLDAMKNYGIDAGKPNPLYA